MPSALQRYLIAWRITSYLLNTMTRSLWPGHLKASQSAWKLGKVCMALVSWQSWVCSSYIINVVNMFDGGKNPIESMYSKKTNIKQALLAILCIRWSQIDLYRNWYRNIFSFLIHHPQQRVRFQPLEATVWCGKAKGRWPSNGPEICSSASCPCFWRGFQCVGIILLGFFVWFSGRNFARCTRRPFYFGKRREHLQWGGWLRIAAEGPAYFQEAKEAHVFDYQHRAVWSIWD